MPILSSFIATPPNPVGLLLWPSVGFCLGIGLFVYGFRLLQRRRLILDTPFSKIRSASMGMVEVSGLAVGPYTMNAPITGRSCYYYQTLVWEWRQEGKNKQWVKVAGDCMRLPFFIDDNTGRVLVDPRGAELDLHRDFQQEFCDSFFSTSEPVPDSVRIFLARHAVATTNKIRVEEYCIKPKNALFLLGTLAENSGVEVNAEPRRDADAIKGMIGPRLSVSFNLPAVSLFRDQADSNIALTSSGAARSTTQLQVIRLSPESTPAPAADMTQQQKIATAMLRAGIANPAAWSAAGIASAGPQVLDSPIDSTASDNPGNTTDSTAQANGFDAHPPAVMMKGKDNKPFLISWRSRQEVARSLGWKCALMIWGGPALALVSLYFFLSIESLL